MKQIFKYNWNNKPIVIEHGNLCNQADSSILVRFGNTVVLVVITLNKNKISDNDFLPLTIIFQDKLYSVGKIPGSFLKREGKPSEFSTLSARLIDRSLRPLIPKNFKNEVQIVINVLSVDNDSDIRVASLLGSSLALSISSVPFNGPVASVLVTLDINNNIIINPNLEQLNKGLMELIISADKNFINMIDASCNEISENIIIDSINKAHNEIKEIINFQNNIIQKLKKNKIKTDLFLIDNEIINFLNKNYFEKLINVIEINNKNKRSELIENIYEEIFLFLNKKISLLNDNEKKIFYLKIKNFINIFLKKEFSKKIIEKNIRIDGRKINEIRKLESQIDILPLVHGSAIFSRGDTQVLSILTLGALYENQIIDGISFEEDKNFMHHYNFNPFSTGEVGRFTSPSRREIGHGALGEKSLSKILPNKEDFPYTIRIVSEVLSSDGSTSQAAICSSILSLMAGGVPIKNPIAGIAMGLIKNKNSFIILTDIKGIEDNMGEMDFKISRSKLGICSLQMDVKSNIINEFIIKKTLYEAKKAIMLILENMLSVIPVFRNKIALTAPKIKTFFIPIEKIKDIIGAGGKVINSIIEKSNDVKIDIKNDGQVTIYHKNYESIEKAYYFINKIISPIELYKEYDCKIVKIHKFGIFVNLKNRIDGLVHVSELSKFNIKKIEDIIKINNFVRVKVIDIDDNGKIKLQLIKIL